MPKSPAIKYGRYRFKNLPVSTGANNVEIVLRDSFGTERRSTTLFYFSDQLLNHGTSDVHLSNVKNNTPAIIIYGSIEPLQNVSTGVYNDQLVVTISY